MTQGFLLLRPGDYVFARRSDGSRAPEDDILVALQVDRYLCLHLIFLLHGLTILSTSRAYGPRLTQDMEEARRHAFGPTEVITPDKPTIVNGNHIGGLLFERSTRSVSVEGSQRVYTIGLSYEVSPNMH